MVHDIELVFLGAVIGYAPCQIVNDWTRWKETERDLDV